METLDTAEMDSPLNPPLLTIVIPVYNEAESIEHLWRELFSVLKQMAVTWEVIFVDDGSTDQSFEELEKVRMHYDGVVLLRLKQNAGKCAALNAGFKASKGHYVVVMDADLQNDPCDIPRLLDGIGDNDLINGVRTIRRDNFMRRWSSFLGNKLCNFITGVTVTDAGCGLKLFKGSTIRKLKFYDSMFCFLPALIKIEGGKTVEMTVHHRPRRFGIAKFNIRNRLLPTAIGLMTICCLKKQQFTNKIDHHLSD